ncbi:hypothetical protein [Paraburkholderia sp. BL10I2N1]|uniref:DUF2515 family protein n=1 Tax=Paraburkholderia sp. BL10I2N1 TaxID=1938796 RepID=UPI001FB74304|nr:hypothetical protein [Paraburkholderia sp. BL10I2N1]
MPKKRHDLGERLIELFKERVTGDEWKCIVAEARRRHDTQERHDGPRTETGQIGVGPAAWMTAYGAQSAAGAATAESGAKVYQMLAKGNMSLFLDVWPLHMFYKKFGLQRFEKCLEGRAQLRGSVVWPIGDRVPFGKPTDEIRQAFRAIDAGNIERGVEALAQHEQLNILQPAMYDDPAFALLMRANQFAWALHIPTGSAREIQLVFANQCTVTGANAKNERFSKEPLANLADPHQRMAFVLRAAQRFNQLLHHPLQKYDVENSLYLIAHPR